MRKNQLSWLEVRQLFPIVNNCTYLNTASRGAVSSRVVEAVQNYYEILCSRGDLTLDDWLGNVETTRRQLADFIGADGDALAFLSNSSLGMNFAAQLFTGVGEVVTVSSEFPSVTLPWLQRNYSVRFVQSQPDGTIRLEDIERVITENTKYLVTSYVQYSTGFRHDLAELGQLCRDKGLIFVVDATQAFGAFPIDVEKHHIDILVFSGYKWATAGYGIAGLYVRKEVLASHKLPAVGWRSAKYPNQMLNNQLDLSTTAAALELGHPPFAGIVALSAAIGLLLEIGLESVERRILELTNYLHTQLCANDISVVSPWLPKHCSGISVIAVDNPKAVAEELKKRNIIVSARNEGLRVSLHFYNDHIDVNRLLSELIEIL